MPPWWNSTDAVPVVHGFTRFTLVALVALLAFATVAEWVHGVPRFTLIALVALIVLAAVAELVVAKRVQILRKAEQEALLNRVETEESNSINEVSGDPR